MSRCFNLFSKIPWEKRSFPNNPNALLLLTMSKKHELYHVIKISPSFLNVTFFKKFHTRHTKILCFRPCLGKGFTAHRAWDPNEISLTLWRRKIQFWNGEGEATQGKVLLNCILSSHGQARHLTSLFFAALIRV